MSKLSRRTVLRVVAGTAVTAPAVIAEASPHPATFPLTHDADLELLELRRAIDAYQAAVRYEMSLPEDTSEHIAAVRESEARQAICAALTEAIHERTPAAQRDVTLRAEAMRMYFFNGPPQCFRDWGRSDCVAYGMAKLYEAAVIVTESGNG